MKLVLVLALIAIVSFILNLPYDCPPGDQP